MRIRTMGRHARESLKNLVRNGWMTFASVSAVAITLLILGVSLVIALNASQMSTYIAGQLEVDVFLQQKVSDSAGQQVAAEVRKIPGVKSVDYISKEKGFQSLKTSVGTQYQNIMDGFSAHNTLPVKLVVKADSPHNILPIANTIKKIPSVAQVRDGKQYVDKLLHVLAVMRDIGLGFVVALVLTAMFLISNTVKITIFARRREIEIMKLVGATNWFIRWPFLMESLIIGAVGAAIPYAVVVFTYRSMYIHVGGTFFDLQFPLLSAVQLAGRLAIVLFGLGLVIGIWGGAMSIRRFLKI